MKKILFFWLFALLGIAPVLTLAQTINVDAPPYNAVGDGVTDDHDAIQDAIIALRSAGGTLAFTSGKTYIISKGLTLNTFPDDKSYLITTTGTEKATIKVKDGSPLEWKHWGIRLSESHNVTLRNLIIDGNRATRNPVGEPSGVSSLFIDGASNGTRLENLELINSPSDNLYIVVHTNHNQTMMTDFEMHNCKLDNAWRNNMSVISGANFKIIGCEFTNANGTAPEAGIDFEPNETSPSYSNMLIEGCLFKDNHNFGIELTYIVTGSGSSTVKNNLFVNNGLLIGSKDNVIHHNIFVDQDHQHKFGAGTRDGVIYFHTGHTATGNEVFNNYFYDNNMPAGSHLIKFMSNSGGGNNIHDNYGHGNTVDGFVANNTDPDTNPGQTITNNTFLAKREMGYWNMDAAEIAGNTINDLSDFNHDGSITAATSVPGVANEALNFAPDNRYIAISANDNLNIEMNFTVLAWIKWSGANANEAQQAIVGRGADWHFGVSNNGQLELVSPISAGTIQSPANTIPTNQWKLATATYNGRRAKLYIDGTEVADEQANGALGTALTNLYIGSHETTTNSFNGAIDDVRIYNYSLSQAEIQTIYDNVDLGSGNITIACPDNINVTLPQGATTMVVDWNQPTTNSTCPVSDVVTLTQTAGDAAGSNFAEGTYTIEYTATDQCNNTETCNFTITVAPFVAGELTIACPNNISVVLPQGATTMVVDWNQPTTNSTCPVSDVVTLTQTAGNAAGSNFAEGTYTIEYTATDQCNNTETCNFTITVAPFVAGNIAMSCPDDINVTLPLGSTTTIVNWDAPTATTTCPINDNTVVVLVGMGPGPGSELTEGSYTIEYNATDECNNSTSCSFNIIVTPVVSGVITMTCPGGILATLPQGDTTMAITWNDPVANTTCSISDSITITQVGPTQGSELAEGLYYVEYTASDECNHSTSCGFSIIIEPSNLESCPDIPGFTKIGELNGHGYYLSSTSNNWVAAQTICQENGGYLASISSKTENDLIQAGITNSVYIGLNDLQSEGDLIWDDGSALSYTNFVTNCSWCSENSEAYDFVSMMPWNGSWTFENQFVTRPFIMEVSCNDANTELTLQSCPSDINQTLPNGAATVAVSWTAPSASTTCDSSSIFVTQVAGLPSGSEFGAGVHNIEYELSDPCGNTTTCSFTITILFDQNGCGDIGGFISLGEYDGHSYYLSKNSSTWDEANAFATDAGGYLTSINTQDENDFLRALLDNQMVFIGLSDAANEGTPVWANGELVSLDLSYDNNSANDYAVMNFWAGTWQMVNHWVSKPYIMEMNCSPNTEISMSCPEDILAVIPEGDSIITINWAAATATTTCMIDAISITQVSGLASGSDFSIGEYLVTYEAIDSCDNLANCSFNILVASDPNNDCGQINGYTLLGEYMGHSYYMSDIALNFGLANEQAMAKGGYLATMNSQDENDSLQSWLGNEMVLIGFNDAANEGLPVWANNEPVLLDLSYNNTEDNDFAVMNFWAGTWGMVNKWVAKRYILEMNCFNSQSTPSLPQTITTPGVKLVAMYPSPANNFVTVRILSGGENEVTFTIFNAQGQAKQVKTNQLQEGPTEVRFDINTLEPGMYFLKATGNNVNQVIRFMKIN